MVNNSKNPKLEEIKNKINELFIEGKLIHVSLKKGRKKVESAAATITEVYPEFFNVRSKVNNYIATFSINYRDIYIKQIMITELENII